MIKIKNLCYKVDNLTLFDDINITIPKNKLTILLGSNGSGKTTLLKIISKIIKPQKINLEKNFKELFYLPQKIKYPKGITLFEYVESSFYKQNWKWFISKDEKEKINNTLELLELSDKKNTLIDNLSSGELQKANLALGLIAKADILLLDEPTSNMDLINQIKVLDIIKKLVNDGITCVLVLHDINLALKYGDYFIGFAKNNQIIQKNKDDFFTNEILKEIYGIDFKVNNDDKNFYIQIDN